MRLRPLLGRLFTRPAPVRRAIRPRTRQLRMTTLEDRTVPAVSILNGGGNGIVGVAGGNPPDTCGAL